MSEEPERTVDDVLLVAQRALSRVNDLEDEVEELRGEYEETAEELTGVMLRLSEISEERPYDGLTRNEKIGMVREHAFNRAVESHGKAALDYNDVMWGVFDGEPGSDHCYDLMEWAAEARGFDVRDDRPRKLVVDAAEAKRGAAFSSENKTAQEESRA